MLTSNNSLYGNYRTRKFADIYENFTNFSKDFDFYSTNGLNPNFQNTSTIQTLFMLLCAKYQNSHIANSDESQFKLKLFSIVFQYGPSWEKNLQIQHDLRNLTDKELITGSMQINNHSWNPSTEPSTLTLDELETTNEQTSTKYKKSKMGAYANLMALLRKDVTEEFLRKFKDLFLIIVEPQEPLWYETELKEDGQND